MSEKRFIRNIMGNIYDSKTDKWFEEDWKGKPLDYDDDLIVFLNEQQATIRKLQDLCGESDGENAKLRIENKRLCDEIKLLKPTNIEQYEQIVQLQEENEQLRKEVKNRSAFIIDKGLGDTFVRWKNE